MGDDGNEEDLVQTEELVQSEESATKVDVGIQCCLPAPRAIKRRNVKTQANFRLAVPQATVCKSDYM